ncbi:MAG: M23 family metallopeptidase [Chloroflexaceae bacterium]|nr:M23 family metallopeptidase [Chloroflexaceae bacterium]
MTLRPVQRVLLLFALFALVAAFGLPSKLARAAAPTLWLPTPVGETWWVAQGFYCGTHTGGLARALDLAKVDGSTYGAPVRAAADGELFVWDGRSGTVILSHGDGYYTEYTHLEGPVSTTRGTRFKQGDVIGYVGYIGTGGFPHLHFVFFRADGPYASNRRGLELDFADGYSFHDTSGCNQHYGTEVIAQGPDTTPPTISFTSPLAVDAWACENQRIEFTIEDTHLVHGFSQAFNEDPAGDAPAFEARSGYVELDWAGEGQHTLHVRAWDTEGHQAYATYGPVGYDSAAPTFDLPATLPSITYTAYSNLRLRWPAASDGDGAGVRGYRLYLGTDSDGTDDWFSADTTVSVGGLDPGRYLLRGQAVAEACEDSAWVTLQELVVVDPSELTTAIPQATATREPTATAPLKRRRPLKPTDRPLRQTAAITVTATRTPTAVDPRSAPLAP